MLAKSYLFVPGDDDKKMLKAKNSGADAVIFCLEDAVAESNKSVAREKVHRKRLIYDVFKNTHLAANLSLVINAGDKTNDSTSKTLCQTISRTMAAHY